MGKRREGFFVTYKEKTTMKDILEKTTDARFNIGDIVNYTNAYGVDWGEFEIVGHADYGFGPRYYIAPSHTPWYANPEAHLTPTQKPTFSITPHGFAEELSNTAGDGASLIRMYTKHGMYKQDNR
jgi:hypothetical protein